MADRWLRASAQSRAAAALVAIGILWAAVLWAGVPVPAPMKAVESRLPEPPSLRAVVAADQRAPEGGVFDRFDIDSQPIVAPVNTRGQVAFYAKLIRAKKAEGMFVSSGAKIVRVAAIGDPIAGGGRISEFARHPVPSLNAAGKVVFGAAVAGGKATDGIFLAADGGLKAIALTGGDAPDIPNGTFVDFDTPAINDRDEIAFVATVRHGRDTQQVLYLYRGGRLVKLVASGDRNLRGGTFDRFGVPALSQKGVIAFAATIQHGNVLGGIYLAGTRDLAPLVEAGQTTPDGAMLVRFSERLTIDDEDNVAFGAHLNVGGSESEAVFLANVSGLTRVASLGDTVPGGGKLAAFGAWPAIGAPGMVLFIAALDGSPQAAALLSWRNGKLEKVAAVGQRLPDGSAMAPFAINPLPSAAANGNVTFATTGDPAAGKSATLWCYGPPPREE